MNTERMKLGNDYAGNGLLAGVVLKQIIQSTLIGSAQPVLGVDMFDDLFTELTQLDERTRWVRMEVLLGETGNVRNCLSFRFQELEVDRLHLYVPSFDDEVVHLLVSEVGKVSVEHLRVCETQQRNWRAKHC